MNQVNYSAGDGLLLSIQMFLDELNNLRVGYEPGGDVAAPFACGCELYTGKNVMRKDVLYVVPERRAADFPADEYAFITNGKLDGGAPHAGSVAMSSEDLLNTVQEFAMKYRDFENALNRVIIKGGSLDELCLVGSGFFKNPLYVHDNLFCILSHPVDAPGMLELEVSAETGKKYIPFWLIDEFKFDDDYQRTLSEKTAAIWGKDQYPNNLRSLFVNIMDGDYYMGRLLINEINSALLPGQFRVAEYFSEYIKFILLRDSRSYNRYYNDFSETINRALDGTGLRSSERSAFLGIMGWKENDPYLCVKLQNQNADLSVKSEGSLRNSLSSRLRGFFFFTRNQQYCLIINVKESGTNETMLSALLAPLVRDGLMYCGISNRLEGFDDFVQGFKETDIALGYIKESPEKWIVTFNDCVLDYLLKGCESSVERRLLVSPGLLRLAESDRQKGTQYIRTLKAYLINERDIPRTSRELIIHRTTLLYRMEKISEMLKQDLESPDVRLYLLICFKLMGL